jgi:hypothetical protein
MRSSDLSDLLRIARRCLPFTSTDGQAFVRLDEPSSGGFFILPVRSPAFRRWFFFHFYAEYDSLPTSRAFRAVLDHLEAQAHHAGDNQFLSVWRRVGARGSDPIPREILLDLADSDRRFVTISPKGWSVAPGDNALFETSRSTVPLPEPVSSDPGPVGQALSPVNPLTALHACLNLPDRAAWIRCLAWLLAAMRPNGPFPVLILQGPPASGKTFAARVLRSLVDPSIAPLTPIPGTVRDLVAVARQNWVLAFDHVSSLAPQIPDALCRISTGLGASLRESPSDFEPLLQTYRRPVIITATSRWSPPPEIAERALTICLPALPPGNRRPEAELLATFKEHFPAILGALCSAVSTALRRLPSIDLPSGRLPDALAWTLAACGAGASACQPEPGQDCFTDAEIREAFAAPVLRTTEQAIRDLLEEQPHWSGTATQLFELLFPLISCPTPKILSEQLREAAASSLAVHNIAVKCRRSNGVRLIDLSRVPSAADPQISPSDAEAPSQPAEKKEFLGAVKTVDRPPVCGTVPNFDTTPADDGTGGLSHRRVTDCQPVGPDLMPVHQPEGQCLSRGADPLRAVSETVSVLATHADNSRAFIRVRRCLSVAKLVPSGLARSARGVRRTFIRDARQQPRLLLALDVHRVIRHGLCGDFFEPMGRLCRNRDHVALTHVVSRSTFERRSTHLVRGSPPGVDHGPAHNQRGFPFHHDEHVVGAVVGFNFTSLPPLR